MERSLWTIRLAFDVRKNPDHVERSLSRYVCVLFRNYEELRG